MRRWLAFAALGAVFSLLSPAWAQRRGGISVGFARHSGVAPHPPVAGTHIPARGMRAVASAPRAGARWGFGIPHAPFSNTRFRHHHHFYPFYPWWWSWGWSFPAWGWGSNLDWESSYRYPQQDYWSQDYATNYESEHRRIEQQQAEIDRLNDEVARLRKEAPQGRSNESSAQSGLKSESQPTELVFRDGRTEAVHNYAVVGQTLWIFTEQRARKVPLSDLDIPATQKRNDDRGVEFEIPKG